MTSAPEPDPPFRDPGLEPDARVADLLGRMSIDEKLAQLGSAWAFELTTGGRFDLARANKHLHVGIGQVTRLSGSTDLAAAEAATLAHDIQRHLREETRLGIPALIHEECLHGVVGRDQVSFPQAIGLASTWDPVLIEQIASVIGDELVRLGAHQGLAPVLDVARDPRWGRIEETFGEDPYLIAAMGSAYVSGLQASGRVIATGKHLVGHGVPEGGMNRAPVHIGARELRDMFLFPFEVAVRDARIGSVMHAYNDLDGIPCVASGELLTDLLRDAWGFDGIVISDYEGVAELVSSHELVSDRASAAWLALTAGVDMELPTTDTYGAPLTQALESGAIDEAVVDRAVARVLLAKVRLGLLDDALDAPAPVTTDPRPLAREAARRSMVLLENDGTLPLRSDIGAIAVIGPNADSARSLLGDYSYPAHLDAQGEAAERGELPSGAPTGEWSDAGRPTVLSAVQERMPAGTVTSAVTDAGRIDAQATASAATVADEADLVVLVLGERSGMTDDCTCGEARDRADIGLPHGQAELLEAVLATGTPVVLVLIGGRPLAIPKAVGRAAAILHAWLPGDEGAEAIADILFGAAEPGGRLPITVPRHVGQVPTYYAHKPSGGRSHWKTDYVDQPSLPLWPFGHGLGYTRFELSGGAVDPAEVTTDGEITVAVDVSNVGDRPGETVVQLYARHVDASVTRPVLQLIGFVRVGCPPGERRRVTFSIAAEQLAFVGADGQRSVEPGRVRFNLGMSSVDLPIESEVRIVGSRRLLPVRSRFLTTVAVE